MENRACLWYRVQTPNCARLRLLAGFLLLQVYVAQEKFSERLLIVQEAVAVQLFLWYGWKDITGSLVGVSLLSVSASEHKTYKAVYRQCRRKCRDKNRVHVMNLEMKGRLR